MSTTDLKHSLNKSCDKENIHTPINQGHSKEKHTDGKPLTMKDQVQACKVSKFEDDGDDIRLFTKKQSMPLKSVENWSIHPVQIPCDEQLIE